MDLLSAEESSSTNLINKFNKPRALLSLKTFRLLCKRPKQRGTYAARYLELHARDYEE